eukprot:PLAT8647.2.p1 GENE.PLAT8647.2~~PLAT8647.2.p1  ORF type:complete len:418 (-),score=184.46 PLAT8647.2:104-1357(-)
MQAGGKTIQMVMPVRGGILLATDPAIVRHILKDNFKNYIKGHPEDLWELLGEGIFNVDGDRWKQQRKTASHLFTVNLLRGFMRDVFVQHGNALLARIGSESVTLDLQDLLYRTTLDAIGEIGFGVNLDTINQERVPFAAAFDESQMQSSLRRSAPLWKLLPWWISERERRIRKSVRVLDDFAYKVIRLRKEKKDYSEREDLLSRFMMHIEDEKYLRDIVLNLMIAGRDTTAIAMSWCCYRLASHPEVQEKAREEVLALLGKDGDATYEDTQRNMPYLRACLLEALRLNPPVPIDSKDAAEDDVLPDGTKVPAGSRVAYMIYCMNRNEDIWGADAEQFKPERWLDRELPPAHVWPVFNAGPRVCLGQNMAYLEALVTLCKLLQTYRMQLEPGQKIIYTLSIVAGIKGGLRMRMTPLEA